MATYASLTQGEKDLLAAFTNSLRAWTGEQARTNNHADASNTSWIASVSTLVGSLDASEVIPNTSGLAGAEDLTKEEVTTLVSHQQNMMTNMSTHTSGFNTTTLRQAWSKACGANNLIG
jgi:hypothetical protein